MREQAHDLIVEPPLGVANQVLDCGKGTGEIVAGTGIVVATCHHMAPGPMVVAAGDTDGDGLGELLTSSPGAGRRGEVYHLRSLPSGVSNIEVAADLTIEGLATDDYLGTGLSGGLDATGDGVPDYLVGAHGHDATSFNAGAAWLIPGIGL